MDDPEAADDQEPRAVGKKWAPHGGRQRVEPTRPVLGWPQLQREQCNGDGKDAVRQHQQPVEIMPLDPFGKRLVDAKGFDLRHNASPVI